MDKAENVTVFGYRAPRVAFPDSLHLEIVRVGSKHALELEGIDISATGVAIAVSDQVPLDETVELAIRSGEDELARIPGRIFYQSDDRYGLAFEFSSEEQSRQVQSLISRLIKTIEYLREPESSSSESNAPGDFDRIHGRAKI